MRAKLCSTSHSKFFDRHEPRMLKLIRGLSSVKDVKTGPYIDIHSNRRKLKLRSGVLTGKVESIFEGWLYLAGFKRQVTIYAKPSTSFDGLEAELATALAGFGVPVVLEAGVDKNRKEDPMQEHVMNGQVSVSHDEVDEVWPVLELIADVVAEDKQIDAVAMEMETKLTAMRREQQEKRASAIEVLMSQLRK